MGLAPSPPRRYDKLQLVVFGNAHACINFEHAPHDGAQVLSLATALLEPAAGEPAAGEPAAGEPAAGEPAAAAAAPEDAAGIGGSAVPAEAPQRLEWALSRELSTRLESAHAVAMEEAGALDCEALLIPELSVPWARSKGVSLDSVFQLAMQLGYYEATGRLDSTYEACSTQGFKAGRTEVVRSVTSESKALVAALRSTRLSFQTATAEMVQAALDAQRANVTNSQQGHGHERHLLALKVQAEEMGRPLPEIFADGGWPKVCTSVVSTSGLRSPALSLFIFGPVTAHGVGLGYLLSADGVSLCVTSWRGKGPPAAKVARAISEACATLRQTVDELLPPPPPRSKL